MSRRFDLIAFDWDGTLFDSTAVISRSIQAAVRDVGGTVPDDRLASHVIGLGLQHALALAAPDVPSHRYRELGERYRHHYMARQEEITLFAGVRELLEDLRQGQHQLAVATGKSRIGLDHALRASGLHGMFAATRTADETAGKPNPLMLHELMSELGTKPARTLMIGDTSHDLKMALQAGCPSIAVSYGAHEPQTLHGMGAEFIAHSVPELRAWLLGTD
jgi:phosphoglycolate phosphatase